MALECAGGGEGVSIDGAVTVTKNRTALSGCIWCRPRVLTAGDTKLIDYSVFNSTNARFTLQWVTASPGIPRVGGRATDGEGQKFIQGSDALDVGVWSHVVGIIDYANSVGMVYINGVLQVSGALTNAPFAATQTANTNSENSSGSGGGIAVRVNATQSFNGAVEDMRLYGRVLSAEEVATIHATRGKDAIVDGLLHHYPLNDLPLDTILVSGATGTVCIAEPERIIGSAMAGTPRFVAGIIGGTRRRSKNPLGARG